MSCLNRSTPRASARPNRFQLRPTVLALLIGGFQSSPSLAASIDFTSTTNGNLATPTNWQNGTLPGSTDTASFGITTPANLLLQNTTLTLQGLVYTPTAPSTTLTLGTAGPSTTTLNLGGIENQGKQQTIAVSTSNATLNISGGTIVGNVSILTSAAFANTNFLAGANAGSALVTIENDGTTTFDGSNAGSSTLTTTGVFGSLLFVNGANAGSSRISNSSGSILGFSDTSSAGSAIILNAGLTTFAGSSVAASALITNAGNLNIANAASLATATLSNSGDTELTGTSTAGQSAINNSGTLNFHDQSSAGAAAITNVGQMSFAGQSSAGSSTITNQSGGMLTFSGTPDASAAHILNSALIDASGMTVPLSIGSLNGSGSLILGGSGVALGALSQNDAISGVISGSGGLTKAGTGQLILSGTSTYTGSTIVSSGMLELDGSLTSPITVANQAILTGRGSTSQDVTLQAGGILDAGKVGAGFHVGGNLTLMPQSIYSVSVDPSGGKSSVSVDGSATVAGAALQIAAAGVVTSYLPSTAYTVLTAQHGVSGAFGSVTTNLAMLSPQVTYGANDVTLSFIQLAAPGGGAGTGINGMTGTGSSGSTGSNGSSGTGASGGTSSGPSSGSSGGSSASSSTGSSSSGGTQTGNGTGSTSPNGALIGGLDNLDQGALANALSSLGASSYGAIRRADLFDADDFARKVAEHRFTDSGTTPVDSQHGWLEIQDRRSSIGSAADTEVNQAGIIGGVELTPSNDGLIALSGQILHSNVNLGSGNNASSDRLDVGVTGARQVDGVVLLGTLSYGQHHDDVHRFIGFGDYAQGPSSHPDGYDFTGYAEASLPVAYQLLMFMPYISAQWTMDNDNGFQESGGSATDLHGQARRANLYSSSLGVRARTLDLGELTVLDTPTRSSFSAGLAWIHRTGCLDGRVDASFLSDPSHSTFMSTASSIGHDVAGGNLALNTTFGKGWHLQLRLDAEAGSGQHSAAAYAGAGYDF